ncbi:unnamed protein product [Mesocestoides corti]|uniref:Uncharacterized protein n=2 Tax=Mesocestoides corti TaxID=53468 RepID=A0A0R3U9Z4_MESCO|nr:unnamed protein product [Mesocestoides corti]
MSAQAEAGDDVDEKYTPPVGHLHCLTRNRFGRRSQEVCTSAQKNVPIFPTSPPPPPPPPPSPPCRPITTESAEHQALTPVVVAAVESDPLTSVAKVSYAGVSSIPN